MKILFNGELADENAAFISHTDRGFSVADGVFDTMLAVDGVLIEATAHFTRLQRHAAVMHLPLPATPDMLVDHAMTLLRINELTEGRQAIRTTVTRGPGPRGLPPPDRITPTLIMRVAPTAAPPETPVRLMIAGVTRRNEQSPLSQIKSLGYGDNLLALMEAKERGAEDAVMLNTAGNVACATTSNVFIIEDGHLITPPLVDGALDGITRRRLLERRGGNEETITPQRLRAAEEILLTNSVAGMRAASLMF